MAQLASAVSAAETSQSLLPEAALAKHLAAIRAELGRNPHVKPMTMRYCLEPVLRHYLLAEGLSHAKVSRKLLLETGYTATRNAIIGAANRFKIKVPEERRYGRKAKPTAPAKPKKQAVAKSVVTLFGASPAKPEPPATVRNPTAKPAPKALAAQAAPEPESNVLAFELKPLNIPVADVEDDMCRFVTDDTSGDMRYCGLQQAEGSKYCSGHGRGLSKPPARSPSVPRSVRFARRTSYF